MLFVAFMVILSFVVAMIMTSNYKKDTSKDRYKLTQIYKELKDSNYDYESNKGQVAYQRHCASCHGTQGQGRGMNPPLKGHPHSTPNMLKIVIKGMKGQITRNGKTYNGRMPGFYHIPHLELADSLNYINQDLNGKKETIHPIEVIKAKIDTLTLKGAFSPDELK